MRMSIALSLAAGAFLAAPLMVPGTASAAPLVLSEHAAVSQELSVKAVEPVGRRRYVRKRRYDWTYYPYWRPYQYRYWQFYYPYGGPLF
jgi:hypothetical protein